MLRRIFILKKDNICIINSTEKGQVIFVYTTSFQNSHFRPGDLVAHSIETLVQFLAIRITASISALPSKQLNS